LPSSPWTTLAHIPTVTLKHPKNDNSSVFPELGTLSAYDAAKS